MNTSDFSTRRPSTSRISIAIDRVARAHGLRRLEGRSPGEHGQAAEDRPLRLGQQVVAPVDRRPQRLVPGDGGPAAAGQQAEPVVEAGRDLLDRERPDARGGELDGERDAVQATAELGDRARILVGQANDGLDRPGPLDEQPAGVDGSEVARDDGRADLGSRQRGDRQDRLAGHAERLAAGHDDPDGRTRPDERLRQLGALGQDRVAVVEDEQEPLALQVVDDRRQERPSGRLGQAEGADDRREHEVRVGEGPAFDDPGPVLELVEERPGQPEADPRLAHAAGTGQGQER